MEENTSICLKVEHARKSFWNHKQEVRAVNDVSFSIPKGKILGLVGQSGCGKSTLARSLVGLVTLDSGNVTVNGNPILPVYSRKYRASQSKLINIVFQSPYLSLNPCFTIRQSLEDVCKIHFHENNDARAVRIEGIMSSLHLSSSLLERYPGQLSGGQCQRVCIARILLLRPTCMVLDEITAALDVVSQRQMLSFLSFVHERFYTSILFITHDLRIASALSDEIAIMHNGEFVEIGDTEQVLYDPSQPYTKAFLQQSGFPFNR